MVITGIIVLIIVLIMFSGVCYLHNIKRHSLNALVVYDPILDEMLEYLDASNSQLIFYPTEAKLEKGESKLLVVGIKNIRTADLNYIVKFTEFKDMNRNLSINDYPLFVYKITTQRLLVGESTIQKIKFQLSFYLGG